MQKLQIESLKSDQLLNEILNTQSTGTTVKEEERSEEIVDIKIEFVDTQLDVGKQHLTRSRALLEYKTDTTELTGVTEQNTNSAKSKNRRSDGVKRKYVKGAEKKISCEVCGTLVAYNLIEFHLNVHNGKIWCISTLVRLRLIIKKKTTEVKMFLRNLPYCSVDNFFFTIFATIPQTYDHTNAKRTDVRNISPLHSMHDNIIENVISTT